jgi:hypothetical protein
VARQWGESDVAQLFDVAEGARMWLAMPQPTSRRENRPEAALNEAIREPDPARRIAVRPRSDSHKP